MTCSVQTGMVEVPETYRMLTGSTSSAAARSWRRSASRVRTSPWWTAPLTSAASTSGCAPRVRADATDRGTSYLGRVPWRNDVPRDLVMLGSAPQACGGDSPGQVALVRAVFV